MNRANERIKPLICSQKVLLARNSTQHDCNTTYGIVRNLTASLVCMTAELSLSLLRDEELLEVSGGTREEPPLLPPLWLMPLLDEPWTFSEGFELLLRGALLLTVFVLRSAM